MISVNGWPEGPGEIVIQGKLSGTSGRLLSGTRGWELRFFNAPSGGSQLGPLLSGTVTLASTGRFVIGITPGTQALDALALGNLYYQLALDSAEPPNGVGPADVFAQRVKIKSVFWARRADTATNAYTAALAQNATLLGGLAANALVTTSSLATGMAGKANTIHIHPGYATTTSLSSGLAAKANTIHIHPGYATTTSLSSGMAAKANTIHIHPGYATTTSLSSGLAAKANTIHIHPDYATTISLNSGLAAKANTIHSHPDYATTTSLSSGLAVKSDLAHTHPYAAASHTHDKSGITNSGTLGFDWGDDEITDNITISGGSVSENSFSAYADLAVENYLNNDDDNDLLTRDQADGRYAAILGQNTLEGGLSIDNTFSVNAGTHRVGIGTTFPQGALEMYPVGSIDQEYAPGSSEYSSNTDQWQSFTAGYTGLLTMIEYFGKRGSAGTPQQGTCTLYIGEGTGGAIRGTVSFFNVNSTPSFKAIRFEAPIPLVAGTVYTIRLQGTEVAWYNQASGSYAGGRNNLSDTSDNIFRTYLIKSGSSLIFTDDGKLGVGTSVPARTLHVNSVMRLQPGIAPTSPAKGDIYMDNTTNKLRVYDGTLWRDCW